MHITQFPQMLLVITMLTTFVFSFPTMAQFENNTKTSKIAKNTLENTKPLVILIGEKNANSGSSFVEFVYNGNSIANQASNEDKYIINSESQENIDKNNNITKIDTVKYSQNTNIKHETPAEVRKSASTFKTEVAIESMKVPSLIAEEESPLVQKWPKYFYDAFNPIPPFPELHYRNLNKIKENKVQSAIFDAHTPNEEQKKSQDTAGPQLNPIPIFDREFRHPIFN